MHIIPLPSMLRLLGSPPARAPPGAARGVDSSPHCCGGGAVGCMPPITWDNLTPALAEGKIYRVEKLKIKLGF